MKSFFGIGEAEIERPQGQGGLHRQGRTALVSNLGPDHFFAHL